MIQTQVIYIIGAAEGPVQNEAVVVQPHVLDVIQVYGGRLAGVDEGVGPPYPSVGLVWAGRDWFGYGRERDSRSLSRDEGVLLKLQLPDSSVGRALRWGDHCRSALGLAPEYLQFGVGRVGLPFGLPRKCGEPPHSVLEVRGVGGGSPSQDGNSKGADAHQERQPLTERQALEKASGVAAAILAVALGALGLPLLIFAGEGRVFGLRRRRRLRFAAAGLGLIGLAGWLLCQVPAPLLAG